MPGDTIQAFGADRSAYLLRQSVSKALNRLSLLFNSPLVLMLDSSIPFGARELLPRMIIYSILMILNTRRTKKDLNYATNLKRLDN